MTYNTPSSTTENMDNVVDRKRMLCTEKSTEVAVLVMDCVDMSAANTWICL